MQKIFANLKLLLKFRIGNFGDIHIAVLGLIPLGVLLHCRLQRRSNTNVINNEATFFVLKYTVDSGDCLHEVVPMHRLIYIHCRQRGYVKACQPHVDNNGNLHRIIVILEFARQLFLVRLCADNLFPVFRVVVTAGHNHTDFLFPCRSNLKNSTVNFHGNGAGIGNNHGLSGQQVCAIFFIVFYNVIAQ